MPLAIVASLAGMSLFAAFMLFKFLQSTALIENKKFRAGGAIAGFIIVYWMLDTSYTRIAGYNATIESQNQTIRQKEDELQHLLQVTKEVTLTGTVTPPTSDTLVLVSASEAPADFGGTFAVKAPCMQGSDQVKLLVTQHGQYFMKYVMPGESKIDVKLPSEVH